MIEVVWLAVKTFAVPIFGWLGRVLSDWRVIAPLIVAALLWASYGAGKHVGRIETEAAQKNKVIAAQGDRLMAHEAGFARLEQSLRAFTRAAARRQIEEAAAAGRLDDYLKRIESDAKHAGCVLDADDARLLGSLDRAAARKPGDAAPARLPGH